MKIDLRLPHLPGRRFPSCIYYYEAFGLFFEDNFEASLLNGAEGSLLIHIMRDLDFSLETGLRLPSLHIIRHRLFLNNVDWPAAFLVTKEVGGKWMK